MTISHVASTGNTAISAQGSTSISVAYPAGVAAGRLAVLMCNVKPETATWNTPSGWTKVGEMTGGTGTSGIRTGPTKVVVFVKVLDGTESGSVTITNTGGNSAAGAMSIYSNGTGYWDHSVFGTGSDATYGSNFDASSSSVAYAAADMLVAIAGSDAEDITPLTQFISARPATFRNMSRSNSNNRSGVHSSDASVGANTAAQEILADSPYFYWRLGELSGTVADDASPNNRDGEYKVTASITYNQAGPRSDLTPGIVKAAPGYLRIPSIDIANQDFTVELWARRDSVAGSPMLWSKSGVYFYFSSATLLETNFAGISTTAPVPNETGVWHHYAFSYRHSPRETKIYIDGIKVGENTPSSSYSGAASEMLFGVYQDYSLGLVGAMDEIALYKSVLTPDRITMHKATPAPATEAIQYYVTTGNQSSGPLFILRLREAAPPPTTPISLSAGLTVAPQLAVFARPTTRLAVPAGLSLAPSLAAQFIIPDQKIRPDADISAGGWTVAPLFSKVDEAVTDDGDFITSDVAT